MAAYDPPSMQDARASNRSRDQPTLRTIADKTGLGVSTVSRALKDGPEISAGTRPHQADSESDRLPPKSRRSPAQDRQDQRDRCRAQSRSGRVQFLFRFRLRHFRCPGRYVLPPRGNALLAVRSHGPDPLHRRNRIGRWGDPVSHPAGRPPCALPAATRRERHSPLRLALEIAASPPGVTSISSPGRRPRCCPCCGPGSLPSPRTSARPAMIVRRGSWRGSKALTRPAFND